MREIKRYFINPMIVDAHGPERVPMLDADDGDYILYSDHLADKESAVKEAENKAPDYTVTDLFGYLRELNAPDEYFSGHPGPNLRDYAASLKADLEAWKRLAVAHENWAASNGSPWAPISDARAELEARGLLGSDEGV